MKQFYMVAFELPSAWSSQYQDSADAQRALIKTWLKEGVISSYSMSLNRSKLWLVVQALSEFDVMSLIAELPLSNYMVPSIAPLMAHSTEPIYHTASLN
ncbi:MAG: hypothetical protein GY810_08575 [Aureispira sp.]|nr:hypothetical protein [Aureispira sp.]